MVTLSFSPNGGTGTINSVSGAQGSTVPLPNTITFRRDGYSFSNFNTSQSGLGTSYTAGTTYTFSGTDETLYAIWLALPTYTLSFSPNEGNGTTINSVSGTQGSTVQLPEGSSLTRSGYNFSGWNTQSNGLGANYTPGATYTFTNSNQTLYAKWSIIIPTNRISFDANGGIGLMNSVSGSQGSTTTLPNCTFIREGYIFSNWNVNSNGSGTSYTNSVSYTFTSNTTLYAQWTSIIIRDLVVDISKYLTYIAGDFNMIEGVTANFIASWSYSTGIYSALPGLLYQCTSLALDKSNILYAGCLGTSSSTGGINYLYKWNGSEWINLSIAVPNTGAVRSIYYYDNYLYVALDKYLYKYDVVNNTFINTPLYTASAGFLNKVIGNDQNIYISINNGSNSNIAKYSQQTGWITYNLDNICFTLVLDTNNTLYAGGSFTKINNINYNRIAKLRNGNWEILGDGSGLKGSARSMIIDKNILYIGGSFIEAGGKEALKITAWDINNSSWLYFPNITDYSALCNTLTIINKEGIKALICGGTFKGLSNILQGETFDIQTNYSLAMWVGRWTKLSPVVVYKQTEGIGETYLQEFTPKSRFFLSNGQNFTRTGYTLTGWNSEKDDGSITSYKLGEAVYLNSSKVLNANWLINSYTLTFDPNEGFGNINNITEIYNSTIILPNGSNFSKSYYSFIGWNTTSDGTGIFYDIGENYNIIENKTLFAVWKINSYTLSFDSNKGTGNINSITESYNSTIILPDGSDLSKSNYSFIGWNTKSDGTGIFYSIGEKYQLLENQTLFAVWKSFLNNFLHIVDFIYTTEVVELESDIDISTLFKDSDSIENLTQKLDADDI